MAATTKPMVTAVTYHVSATLKAVYDAVFGVEANTTGVVCKPNACIDVSNVASWTNSSASGDAKDIVLFKLTRSDGATRYVIYDDSANDIVISA